MATPTLTADTFKNLKFSDIRVNKNRSRAVYLSTPEMSKIFVKLPELKAPYGLSTYVDEKAGTVSYSLDLSLTPEMEQIFSELDEKVLTEVADKSEQWLGRKYSRDILAEALYKSLVRKSKKPEYPSTVRLKIYCNLDGSLVPKAFDSQKNPIRLEQLRKGQDIKAVVNVASIWFIDNKFGVSLRLHQAQFAVQDDMDRCMFDDETDEIVDVDAGDE